MRDYRASKARGRSKPARIRAVADAEPAHTPTAPEPPRTDGARSLGEHMAHARDRLWGASQEPGEAIADTEPSPEWQEIADSTEPDPDPVDGQDDRYNKPPEDRIFTVSKVIREDIEGKIGFFWGMSASAIQMFDPYCGSVMVQRTEIIAAKMTPIICKSPDLVNWFSSKGGGYMEWLDLAIAFWPVMEAIYAHHLAKSVDNRPVVDATTPPMQPDYSQYAAA